MSTTKGRVAVVTGAASGMGLAIARRLAEQGDRVALRDRHGDAAGQAAKELSAVHDEFGPVEILVASAGIEASTPVVDITIREWDRMIAVDLTGTFHCIQTVVPDMQARAGAGSSRSPRPAHSPVRPNKSHYAASKGGVIALTKALAFELGPAGITVNTIPPGIIDTPMARQSEKVGNLDVEAAGARMPLRRAGTVEEIAATCAFLCSDGAGYVTGQTVGVNGGYYM